MGGLEDPAGTTLRLVPNDQADVSIPQQLTQTAKTKLHNTLLEAPHEYARVGSNVTDAVQAEPRVVHFAGITAGDRLEVRLRLLNTSGEPLRMHIHPPTTPFFSMRCDKRGRVMPGMAEEVIITCMPTDLRYYSDCIRVHCGSGNLIVPIHAYPGVSAIDVPRRIDFGKVPLDSSASTTLPLRAAVPVEFEYAIEVVQASPDLEIAPLEGVVPALGDAAIDVWFRPTRFATARAIVRLSVSQFNFEPIEIEIVGSCAPGEIRQAHLKHLTRLAADEIAQGATALEELAGAELVGEVSATGLGASVLVAPPQRALISAVATAGGGGSGGGDAVTKAMVLQLKAEVAGKDVEVKLPDERPPPQETQRDGFRVPPALDNQIAVNRLLLQEAGKIPVKELRVAIAQQNEEAARQQAALEAAAQATQSVQEQLRQAMAANALQVVALFRELDADGSGQVDREEFAQALPLLKIRGATAEDMARLFDEMDADGSGTISYGELKQARQASVAQLAGQFPEIEGKGVADVAPEDIDASLQGESRSRQLKELLFSRQIASIDKYEKDKEVKSFVALGEALMPPEFQDHVRESRHTHAAAVARAARERARARTAAAPTPERAPLSEEAALQALSTAPSFDPYLNDNWGMRQQALPAWPNGAADGSTARQPRPPPAAPRAPSAAARSPEASSSQICQFEAAPRLLGGADAVHLAALPSIWLPLALQVLDALHLGVRAALLRARVARRTRALRAALLRANVALTDRRAVRALVLDRARSRGGAPPSTAAAAGEGEGGDAAADAGAAAGGGGSAGAGAAPLALASIAPFVFPSEPGGGGGARAEPISVSEIAPFDELRVLPLRVARRHAQMGYEAQPLTAPGAFPALETARELRCGAAFEEGRPLPSGEPGRLPETPMPPALINPPLRAAEPSAQFGNSLAAPPPAAAPAGAPAAEAEAEADDAAAALPAPPVPPSVAAALAAKAAGPSDAVRVLSAPPPFCETDAAMQLRPKPVAANGYWRDEATGCGAGLCLLRQPTISSRWRAARDAWPDALVPLPRPMRGGRSVDTADELSEDESDTEVEFAPPTEARLRELFLLPDAHGRFPAADGAAPPDDAEPAAAPPAGVGVADGWVAAARVLPLDAGSELAREEAALQAEQEAARKQMRERLRERTAALNALIEPPRLQLSLS